MTVTHLSSCYTLLSLWNPLIGFNTMWKSKAYSWKIHTDLVDIRLLVYLEMIGVQIFKIKWFCLPFTICGRSENLILSSCRLVWLHPL